LVTALETWVFGVILALIGFLVAACGFVQNDLGVSFIMTGIASGSFGSLIFVYKFKQWIDNL
jgi:hypothetical protein